MLWGALARQQDQGAVGKLPGGLCSWEQCLSRVPLQLSLLCAAFPDPVLQLLAFLTTTNRETKSVLTLSTSSRSFGVYSLVEEPEPF